MDVFFHRPTTTVCVCDYNFCCFRTVHLSAETQYYLYDKDLTAKTRSQAVARIADRTASQQTTV